MRHNILSTVVVCICALTLDIAAAPMRLCAEDTIMPPIVFEENDAVLPEVYDENGEMPHLIQTVTEQDIYEGMLALGLLESTQLKYDNCEEAYENVKNCVVSINMGNAHGSGLIWEITSDGIVIVTNKHVLAYWDEFTSYVKFPQGYYTDAEILGISKEHDIGFLIVEGSQLDYSELEKLRYVRKDMEAYEMMKNGDEIFCLGAESGTNINDTGQDKNDENFYKGSIGDMNRYIDEFGEYMIYGLGYAKPGMSGGGTFDAKGNMIGMISGGTADNETASVPLSVIIEEYDDIKG